MRSEMESSAAVCIRCHVYLRSPFQRSGRDGQARVTGARARVRGWFPLSGGHRQGFRGFEQTRSTEPFDVVQRRPVDSVYKFIILILLEPFLELVR